MKILLATIVIVSLLCGCVTTENYAYKIIGSASVLADSSMQAWAEYVARGKATPLQEISVRSIYTRYQAAMATTKKAVMAYKAGQGTKSDLESTADVLQSIAMDLSSNINLILKPTP